MSADESKLENLKIYAIVPAAGQSERMGHDVPKQYIKICGIPLVGHCLRALSAPTWIHKVIVVVDDLERYTYYLKEEYLPKVIAIQGGQGSRHRSIFEGLKTIEKENPDIVVIHDGARPIVPRAILAQVTLKAAELGAAGVVRPLVSTVVRPDAFNILEESLQRSLYRNSEMPQAFRYGMILQAYKKCTEEILEHGTECLAVAQNFGGVKAFLMEGTSDLWKVTHPQDIETAKYFLPKHCLRIKILCLECPTKCPTKYSKDSSNQPASSRTSNLHAEGLATPLQKFLKQESTFMNKENCSLLCSSIISTLRAISPCLLHNSFSSDVITDITLLETEAEYLLSISCLKTISDAENLLNTIKGKLKPKKNNIITIFNAHENIPPEGIILSLRQTMEKLYSDDNIVAMVRRRDCQKEPSTQHDSQYNYNQKQLTLMIEQCLKSPILESLHSQVLFY